MSSPKSRDYTLTQLTLLSLVFSALTLGCDDDSSPAQVSAGSVSMNDTAGEGAGQVAGQGAGEIAGQVAGEVAGQVAGEIAGQVAGEVTGGLLDSPCGVGLGCGAGYTCLCELDTRVPTGEVCECVAPTNRAGCDNDLECREGEECRAFTQELTGQVTHICWLSEDELSLRTGRSDTSGEVLFAGASSRVITPRGFETARPAGLDGSHMNFSPPLMERDELWNDCGYDGLCPGDAGYTVPDDGEGDGELQGVFIAGFSHGRPAQYCPEELIGCDRPECCVSTLAHDDLKAQTIVIRRGELTLGWVALDIVGLFHTDISQIKRELTLALQERPELGAVDHLIVASSHSHEGPDTIGQYGPGTVVPLRSGRDPRWVAYLRAQVVQGVIESLERLRPARAEFKVIDEGIRGLGVSDSRPPYLFDDNIPVLRLLDIERGETIATLLSVANHAEFLWSDNVYLSADYFHYTRRYIREGLEAVPARDEDDVGKPELTGWGGVVVMFAGAVGGLMNPGRATAIDYAGRSFSEKGFAMADAAGQQIAARMLSAYARGEFEEVSSRPIGEATDAPLSYATQELLTPIENSNFLLAGFALRLFRRDIYNASYQGGIAFFPDVPRVLSEVSAVRLGRVTFFTAPGEVFPELLTGGYPGQPYAQTPVIGDIEALYVDQVCDERGLPAGVEGSVGGEAPCIVKATQENPPTWSDAPSPPYVYERAGEAPFFIGLAGDFLGYLVPPYDFEDEGASGSHYEETNSASVELAPDWEAALRVIFERL